jgi:hypothetical protein
MARESGLLPILNEDAFQKWEWEKTKKVLKRFEALVRADERERVMNEPLTKANWQRFEDEIRADERNSWPAEMEAMERQVNILTDALSEARRNQMICDECETVAHCTKHGCVPKHQALDRMAKNARELGLDYETAPAQPAPVQEPVAWVNHGENRITRATGWDGYGALYTTPPAAQRQWVEVEQIKWDGDKLIAKLKENT